MKKEEDLNNKEIKEDKKKKGFHVKLIDFLLKRPILKFVILLIIQFVVLRIPELFPRSFPLRLITMIFGIILAVYFIITITHIVRTSIKHLMEPKSLFHLIGAYILLILVIISVSSILYNFVDLTHLGYIQYGNCNGNFNPSIINNSPQQEATSNSTISKDFFYFSAITFFTVGYGDICPMGFAKIISVIIAFMGNIVSVILVAFIINNYLQKRKKE